MIDTVKTLRQHRLIAFSLVILAAHAAPAADSAGELHALIASSRESGNAPLDRWPDLGLKTLRGLEASDRAALQKLRAIPRGGLTSEDRTLYDLLEWSLNRRLEQFRLRLYLTPFWRDFRYASNAHLLDTAAGLEREPQRKASYPAHVTQVIALMREAARERMLPARELVRPYVEDCAARSAAAPPEARQAAGSFCGVLRDEYYPACPESRSLTGWPNGAEVYRELVRANTTTGLDPREVHQFGLREVARIRAAMLPVIARTGYQGSLDEFLAYARTDSRFYFTSGGDLLAAYRAALDRIVPLLPRVIGHIPHRPLEVRPYSGSVAAMWHAPQPGQYGSVIYVATDAPEIHPKFEIVSLMLHEGLPGHELQHAVADEFDASHGDPLTAFAREAGQNLAYAEGWALYSEGLGREMGLYADPYDEFGELRWELTRAVRVVIDTGIHELGWSGSQAKDYFLKQTGKPEAEVNGEISRTLWPGGQLAYKVGQFRLQQMREATSRALGPHFDLRAFHDAVLRWGPLPLDILDRKLNECLDVPACRGALGGAGAPDHRFSSAAAPAIPASLP